MCKQDKVVRPSPCLFQRLFMCKIEVIETSTQDRPGNETRSEHTWSGKATISWCVWRARKKQVEEGGGRRKGGERREEGGERRKEGKGRSTENEEGEEEMGKCIMHVSPHTPHLYYWVTVDLNSSVVHLNRKSYQSPEDRVSLLTKS